MVLRNTLIISIISLYLLSTNMALVYLVSHRINIDYIVKYLCVQKDEEENLCGGLCQLKNNLESKDDEPEKTASESLVFLTLALSTHNIENSIYHTFNTYHLSSHLLINDDEPLRVTILPDIPPPKKS